MSKRSNLDQIFDHFDPILDHLDPIFRLLWSSFQITLIDQNWKKKIKKNSIIPESFDTVRTVSNNLDSHIAPPPMIIIAFRSNQWT